MTNWTYFGLNEIDSTTDSVYTWHPLIGQDLMESTAFGISSHLLATKEMANRCFDYTYVFREGTKMSHISVEYENHATQIIIMYNRYNSPFLTQGGRMYQHVIMTLCSLLIILLVQSCIGL